MNQVHYVSITKGGRPVFQFVCYDDKDRAGFLAGEVMDRLCDYHGGNDWWYTVSAAPYVASTTSPKTLVDLALSKAVV